jgi:hypothetical protein
MAVAVIGFGYTQAKIYYEKGYNKGWQDKDSVRLFNNEFMP